MLAPIWSPIPGITLHRPFPKSHLTPSSPSPLFPGANPCSVVPELQLPIPVLHCSSTAIKTTHHSRGMVSMASTALVPVAAAAAPAVAASVLVRRSSSLRVQQPSSSSSSSSSSWACRAASKDGEMSDMSNVGLDDVFNLIQQASDADPEPQDLVAKSSSPSSASLTGAASWYAVYGRSVSPSEDARSSLYGPKRPLWKGPFTKPQDVPSHLKGEYPGDYGCDLFQLCRLPANFSRLRSQELMNGRWAMLGITGCLLPELLHPESTTGFEPVWFKTGAQIFSESGIDYLGVPGFVNAHSVVAVAVVQGLLMGVAEMARVRMAPEGGDAFYPGGRVFDPLGFSSDPEALAELKVKEIKNGRLAMLAMAGLFAQGAVTGASPLQNLHEWLH